MAENSKSWTSNKENDKLSFTSVIWKDGDYTRSAGWKVYDHFNLPNIVEYVKDDIAERVHFCNREDIVQKNFFSEHRIEFWIGKELVGEITDYKPSSQIKRKLGE